MLMYPCQLGVGLTRIGDKETIDYAFRNCFAHCMTQESLDDTRLGWCIVCRWGLPENIGEGRVPDYIESGGRDSDRICGPPIDQPLEIGACVLQGTSHLRAAR